MHGTEHNEGRTVAETEELGHQNMPPTELVSGELAASFMHQQTTPRPQALADQGEADWIVHTRKKSSKKSKAPLLAYVTALPSLDWTQQPYSVSNPCSRLSNELAVTLAGGGHRKTGIAMPRGTVKSTRFKDIMAAANGRKKVSDMGRCTPSSGLWNSAHGIYEA